ncbi:MFS transporter [Halobacteria archaeon AArc-m2/3/4]|uniref:MFS transporter n=1 Tax=Natronoglomus mannanivorans TaxID=2979990 RepID=A0ABT2QAS4_9EURY|nr:MFS transporter [Halobacteria archaeon AArc-m2/3/4]
MNWRYRDTVLTLCTVALFVTMVGRLAISPVVPDIATEFEVSNALIGLALTGMWVAYALTQFPSGVLADRYGERLVILASVGGTGLTGLVIAVAPTFGVFVLGTILLGAVAGLHYSVATALLTRIYDDIGTAIGLHNAGAPIAGLVTPIAVAQIAAVYGWRPAVAVAAVLALPLFVLIMRGIRPTEPRRPDQPMRERLELAPILELLSRPAIVFTGVIAIISDFTWQAIASFLPTFFVQYHGYSRTLAGTLFAAYFVAQGVLQIGVGVLADRIGRDVTTAICMVTGIVGLALLVVGPEVVAGLGFGSESAVEFGAIGAGIVLLGLSMGWSAAVFPRFMDHLSAAEQSSGFGLIRTVYMVVAASGSVVVGLLADLFGWAVSFGFLIALLAVVCVLLVANEAFGLEY